MIITLINFISEKINNFRRRNRNQPVYYRLFLFWLTLIILITAIFYILNNLGFENNLSESKLSSNISQIPISTPIETGIGTGIQDIPITGIQDIAKETVDQISSNLVSTVSQQGIYDAPKTELYHEVLNNVAKIPKPLSFVDDFDYKL
jgi:hypothetical protein